MTIAKGWSLVLITKDAQAGGSRTNRLILAHLAFTVLLEREI